MVLRNFCYYGSWIPNTLDETRWLNLVLWYRYYIVLFWVISSEFESQNQVTYIFLLENSKLRCSYIKLPAIVSKKLLMLWVLYLKTSKRNQVIKSCSLLQLLHNVFLGIFSIFQIRLFMRFQSKTQSLDAHKKTFWPLVIRNVCCYGSWIPNTLKNIRW